MILTEDKVLQEQLRLAQLEKTAKENEVIITICAYCKKTISVKDGYGVYGISHGICTSCKRRLLREYKRATSPEKPSDGERATGYEKPKAGERAIFKEKPIREERKIFKGRI